jgi:hypothetical protein
MRSLVLLALAALAAFPLSAHDHWRGPRRVVVIEAPRCAPYRHWDDRRCDDRWERRAWYRRHDCDDDRVIFRPLPRPLVAPFEGRVELRLR